ncbi:exported hypothetical protein [Candidatus Sulfopaludibacter sp. SbA3]|nr:exported hypothetical protein [Candidatus Sulfopaludibacter sp. SbA3]
MADLLTVNLTSGTAVPVVISIGGSTSGGMAATVSRPGPAAEFLKMQGDCHGLMTDMR